MVDVSYFDIMYNKIINLVNSNVIYYHVQICSIVVRVRINKIQKMCYM